MNRSLNYGGRGSVIQGDCLEVLKNMPSNHFDSLITDPP